MGNASSESFPNYRANIKIRHGRTFMISYYLFVEHILLLRKVIHHPEMRKEGPLLDSFIQDYCQRMARGEMRTADQQLKLPWQIEWIWHVHRLHPLAYLNDCSTQFSDGLVDKKIIRLTHKHGKINKSKTRFSSASRYSLFVPSINLRSAVNRQNDFLDKFQKHFLYSYDLKQFDELRFQNLVQNYVSFIKLAKKGETIVPTFDIDLIWHQHMRFPSHYHQFSEDLCGFILDHDDAIVSSILTHVYQITADRWKQTYQSEYGTNVDRKYLETSQYLSSCAMVFSPIMISTTANKPIHAAGFTGCGSSCGSVGVTCGGGDYGGGGDGGGGGCDGGGGGDGGCGGGCGGD